MGNEESAGKTLSERRGEETGKSVAGMLDEELRMNMKKFQVVEPSPDSSFFILHSSFLESFDLDAAMTDISEQRREQAVRIGHVPGRRLCVAAYLLLRYVLVRDYGLKGNPEFGYYEGGKPFMENRPDIHFSISHCRKAVACAVSPAPIGIDVETIRPYKQSLARRVLNDEELYCVETSARPDIEFIKLWTMKESLLKMTGEGIRSDLRKVPLSQGCFTTTVDEADGYVCTVCREHPEASPEGQSDKLA